MKEYYYYFVISWYRRSIEEM